MIKSILNILCGIKDMARPRVFISSTYYDLKQIRIDIDRFLKEIGYESVRNETGQIPYGKSISPEDGCYKEIANADIVVSIIGGKFGTTSNDNAFSISQRELKKALEQDKQVFIFIDKAVYAEYNLWYKNKDKEHIDSIDFYAVDNKKIFEHIEAIKALDNNNAYTTFESSHEIVGYLREQFAGLFQQFLQQQKLNKEINLIAELSNTSNTLQQMIKHFSEANKDHNSSINELVLSNHPAMTAIKKVLGTKIRVFFLSYEELGYLLNSFGYKSQIMTTEDESCDIEIWIREIKKSTINIFVSNELFDKDGKLKPIQPDEWKESYVTKSIHEKPDFSSPDFEVPF